jgi:hypothetical protein
MSSNIQKLNHAPTDSDICTFTTPTLQPDFERKPTNLTLTANSTIVIGNSAVVQTDAGASLTIKATPLVGGTLTVVGIPAVNPSYINIFGTLSAPGGNITLDAGSSTVPALANAYNTIYLGPASVIEARGASLLTVDAFGNRVGSVLDGGTVTVQNTLDFIAKPGSVIDVSGTETTLDLATGRLIGLRPQFAPGLVSSNGGSISLSAFTGLFLDGALLGRPGDYGNPAGSVAKGGSLTIDAIGNPTNASSVRFANGGLIISQNGLSPVAAATGTIAPRATALASVTVLLPIDQQTVPLPGYTAYGAGGLPFDTTHVGSLGSPNNPGGYTLYGTGGLPFDAKHPQPPGYTAYYYKDYATLYYQDVAQVVTNQEELGDIFTGNPTYVLTYITPAEGGKFFNPSTSQTLPATEVQLAGGSNVVEIPGTGFVNAHSLEAGAFDSVSLKTGSFLEFSGNAAGRNTVNLEGINNLEIHAPNISATNGTTVNLSAQHLWLDGGGNSTAFSNLSSVSPGAVGHPAAPLNNTVLNVYAGTLDLNGFGSGQLRTGTNASGTPVTVGTQGGFALYSIDDTLASLPFSGLGRVNFVAGGDMRFVAAPVGQTSDNSIVLNGPVSFQATQIYPLSTVAETIIDYYQPLGPNDPSSIAFGRSSTISTGITPLSAGASLSVFGSVITQGG